MIRRILFCYVTGIRQIISTEDVFCPDGKVAAEIGGLQFADGSVKTMKLERLQPSYILYNEVVPEPIKEIA